MVYIFSQPFLYTFIFTGIGQMTACCLPLRHRRGCGLWLWVGPSGPVRPLDRRGSHLHNKLVPLRPGTFAFC